jgi:hypothetical protein
LDVAARHGYVADLFRGRFYKTRFTTRARASHQQTMLTSRCDIENAGSQENKHRHVYAANLEPAM